MSVAAPQNPRPTEVRPPLSEEEQARILAEEQYRHEVRLLLQEAQREGKKRPSSGLVRLLGNESFRWLLTTLLIPLLGVGWGLFQDRQAQAEQAHRRELVDAELQKREELANAQRSAEVLVPLLPYLTDPLSERREMALVILGDLRTKQALPAEVEAALVALVRRLEDQSLSAKGAEGEGARKALEAYYAAAHPRLTGEPESTPPRMGAAPPSSEDIAPSEPRQSALPVPKPKEAALPVSMPRVYIHIYSENSRAAAEKLRAELRKGAFLAPGVENVIATSRGKPMPRIFVKPKIFYFNDADAESAAQVAELARSLGVAAEAQPEKLAVPDAPQGQIEVWLAKPTG